MSGKRAKQLRLESGKTIAARRMLRQFDRAVAVARETRADHSVRKLRLRRKGLAIFGLVLFVVALVAAVASSL